MQQVLRRSIALIVALLAIVACGQERSASPRDDAPEVARAAETTAPVPTVVELREPVAPAN